MGVVCRCVGVGVGQPLKCSWPKSACHFELATATMASCWQEALFEKKKQNRRGGAAQKAICFKRFQNLRAEAQSEILSPTGGLADGD